MTASHSKPPWIAKAETPFHDKKETQGNKSEAHSRYNSDRWRKASARYFRGKKCAIEHCQFLAELTDHIIPIEQGGSQWDRRNWQPMCKKHHDRKRGKEAHGYHEERIGTPYGYIPKRMGHFPPDIEGQSHLVR